MEKRNRYGDLEVDLIVGTNHKSALLVTTDRATIKTTINKLTGRDSKQVTQKLIARRKKCRPLKR